MDKTDGSITSSYGDWTREDFLFTYSEEERQELRFNKMVVEQEIKWYSYFLIYEQQLILWFTGAEAIIFNFIDWYTKAWKFFWYSIPQICNKVHRWRDKVINVIKSLLDKWYIVETPWKDRYWRGRRFLSTTMKYNSELANLVYQSENPTIPVGKSDGYQSENPTHSNIYSNINNIDICLPKQKNSDNIEETQDNTKERKENVAAKEKKERSPKKSKKRMDYPEDYEKIWRIYPHNHCVKQDVYWLWQQYSEEEKARLLIWAQIEELDWNYVEKWKIRMSNRMDRWMDSYTLTKDWIPEFVDIVDKLNNIQDEQTRKEWLDKAREYFGEDYVRTALSKVTKKITLEFH